MKAFGRPLSDPTQDDEPAWGAGLTVLAMDLRPNLCRNFANLDLAFTTWQRFSGGTETARDAVAQAIHDTIKDTP